MAVQFIVEQNIGNDWENVWLDETEAPQVFESAAAAYADLKDHVAWSTDAVAEGFLDDVDNIDDFRIIDSFGEVYSFNSIQEN